MIDGALGAAGVDAAHVGLDKLAAQGVLYDGLATLGGGATLAGIVLASILVFVIERAFTKAAIAAFVGACLAFFGLIHAEAIGFARSPTIAVSYLVVALLLVACARAFEPAPERHRENAIPELSEAA